MALDEDERIAMSVGLRIAPPLAAYYLAMPEKRHHRGRSRKATRQRESSSSRSTPPAECSQEAR